ncbi:MAG TPA: extracellular solute-binding protein [Spirochaetia bacterium]|nr:extracellular solute-binding protein [Spirochaetia bacterium]
MRKQNGIVLACFAAAMFLAATGVWATGQKESSGTAPSGGKVTLVVWDEYTGTTLHDVVQAVINDFEKTHPNVTVEETGRTLAADKTAVMAAINAGVGPDVITANNGETEMGPEVRAGALVNLTPYAQKYGWEKNYLSADLWSRAMYTADGKHFGRGNLYGVPLLGEYVGVYYNKDLFAKYGLSVPKTLGDLQKAAETFKASGIAPFAFGGSKYAQFYHQYGEVLGATLADEMGGDAAENWLSGTVIKNDPSLSFNDPAVVQAAKIMQDWAKNGDFMKGFTGLDRPDAFQYFVAGKAAMFIEGSWYDGDIIKANLNAGVFAFPPIKESTGMVPQVGGMATPVGINSKSKHIDLAAEFLNVMLSSENAHKFEIDNYMIPPTVPTSLDGVQQGSVYYELLSLWNGINANNRVGQYLDWATPQMGDVMGQAGQDLLAGSITPQQFADKVEAAYKSWTSQNAK